MHPLAIVIALVAAVLTWAVWTLIFRLPFLRRWPRVGRTVALLFAVYAAWRELRAVPPSLRESTPASSYRQQTPYEQIADAALTELKRSPGYENAFVGLTRDEATAKFKALANRGIARLDDSSLVVRTKVMSKILAQLSDSSCAAFARDAMTPGTAREFTAAMATLDLPTYRSMLQVQVRAASAELAGLPIVPVNDTLAAGAVLWACEGMSSAARDSVVHGLSDVASDAEKAHALRTLFGLAVSTDGRAGEVLRRALNR